MSDTDSPPAKRMRRSARCAAAVPSTSSNTPSQSRYVLRSNSKPEDLVTKDIRFLEYRRKRPKYRLQKLMHLNDDCLLTIFEQMDPNTLSHVAETCGRLKDLTRYQFRIKHTTFSTALLVEHGPPNIAMMKKILVNFGDLIKSLQLFCSLFGETPKTSYDLLKLVKRYCTNLKTLTLEDFDTNQNMEKLKSMFQPIETLVLDNCVLNMYDLGASNLKALKIHGGGCLIHIIDRNFAKLEQVEFEDVDYFRDSLVMRFINQNPTIKRLSIVGCDMISTKIFAAISQLKLEELEFHQYYRRRPDELFNTDLMQLASMATLKVLKLNCTKITVSCLLEGFVKNKIAIEHLELVNGVIDEATHKNIIKLKTIKTLRLNEMADLSNHHILIFVKELKLLENLHIKTVIKINQSTLRLMVRDGNLKNLKIDSPLILDIDTYNVMLATIQKLNTRLDLTIYGNGNQLSVPGSIANGPNEKWFTVKELNRNNNQIFSHPVIDEDFEEFDDFLDGPDEEDFLNGPDGEDFLAYGSFDEDEEVDGEEEEEEVRSDGSDTEFDFGDLEFF